MKAPAAIGDDAATLYINLGRASDQNAPTSSAPSIAEFPGVISTTSARAPNQWN